MSGVREDLSDDSPWATPFRPTDIGQHCVIPKCLIWPFQSKWGDAALVFALNARHPRSEKRLKEKRGWLKLAHVVNGHDDGSPWDLQSWTPQPLKLNDRCFGTSGFRYCRGCLRVGYHSPIHMLPWITHCPFHLDQMLQTPCRDCRREAFTQYLSIESAECPRCAMLAINRRDVVMRPTPPPEGLAILERYRRFLSDSSALVAHDIRAYEKRRGCVHPVEASPKLVTDVAWDEPFTKDLAVASGIIARRLGYDDLCRSVMRGASPSVRIFRAPLTPKIGYQSIFDDGDSSPWDLRPWSKAEKRGKENRRFEKDGQFYAMTGLAPCGRNASTGVRVVHKRVKRRLGEAIMSNRSVNCRKALAQLQSREEVETDCRFCAALDCWFSSTHRTEYVASDYSPQCRLTYPRQLNLPPSPAADRIRSIFLELDLVEQVLIMKDAYKRDSAIWIGEECYEIEDRLAVLFQRFLAFRIQDEVELVVWNVPDPETELVDALQEWRCQPFPKR